MRLRPGLNRPPPLVKPYQGEDDNNFSSFDRTSPGKRHLPLRTRRRHDSFRSRLEYDEFTAQKSGLWKGESLEEYNDFERWRGESHEQRRNGKEGRRATLFDPVESHSSPNQDWCDVRNDTHRTDSSYLGGYDFRDDVESIDTFEGKQRRQRRLAETLQEGYSFTRRSPLPLEYHPITVECPHDFSLEGFERSKNNFIGRDGSTATSTIATDDDDDSISQLQSVSTKSNDSGLNPQLLHAKSVPELPPGYLQRHDGVVISIGSSIVSSTNEKERYADIDEHAETAAQSVVDQLRALGYKVDDTNGILGSNSDSGIFSKYGGKHSWTPSIEATSARSHASITKTQSKRSQDKTRTQDVPIYGMQYPPALSTHSSRSIGRGFAHRIKAKTNSNELQSHGSRKSSGNATTTIDAQSHGSRRLNTKQLPDTQGMPTRNSNIRIPIDEKPIIIHERNNNSSNDARSTGSKKSKRLVHGSNRSNSSKNGERQSKSAYPPASSASEVRNLTLDRSELEENTYSKASTVMADGSTLTSRPDDPAWNPQRRSMIFDLSATQFATLSHASSYHDSSAMASNHVNFLGHYPEITGDGDRVPELVTRLDGLTSVTSDLSHQRSAGGSTLSSLTFNNNNKHPQQQPPLTTFCEKVLYSCRISAFPSTRGG